jgi:hypothetical protein
MLRIASRKFVAFSDHESWDYWVRLGQRIARPFASTGKTWDTDIVHSELAFSNGLSLTATTDEGIVLRENTYAPHIDFWRFRDVPGATAEDEAAIIAWAENEITERKAHGYGYDFRGVIRFVLPFMRQSSTNYFCSEAAISGLQQRRYLPGTDAWRICPAELDTMPLVRDA